MVKLKMTILAFSCMVLCGCFVNHLLNYPFRLSETIASFPIDPDSREPQIFELDNIKSDKIFYLYRQNLQGPYSVDICTDDSLYTDSHNIKWSITMITDGIEPKTKTRDLLFYGGVGCSKYEIGWTLDQYVFPKDFNRNQKVTLIFQILEDKEGFLKARKNPKLVVWAGTGTY